MTALSHHRPGPTEERPGETPDTVRAGPVDLRAWLGGTGRPQLDVPLAPTPPRLAGARTPRVALVGGGVDRQHPDLAGAHVVVWPGGRGLAPDVTATAYASLLVGQGVAHARGLVPDAVLLVAAVEHPDEPSTDAATARAVRWCVGAGAEVIVLPYGRRRLGRRLTVTLHAAMAHGTRVFAAAGDLGPDILTFPGSVTGVVAVTAHDGSRLLAGCSACADIAAPGADVPAAGPRSRTRLRGSGAATVLAAGAHLTAVAAEPDTAPLLLR
ncbi:S8/S53 family peptidase [Isoptericola sp. b441]|uniref:S8/S53 family peptidase n=1 Tax=Actinotalea lenta TaxID=3064654 RepID=A0ABT9D4U6_9CELL|nr:MULTISPECIES: S8/S53 family peptidase [unclassified Isoptericola]MDO8105737.1 S8/S53 family peptidase [Isoptericola sp. b441]MDO8122442.1 S8/S53 family peptidase [Isoptericola sp. b490]